MQVRVVQGKGKKDRYSILTPKALHLLRIYYKIERPRAFLFESQGKKGVQPSDRTLLCIVKTVRQKQVLKKGAWFIRE